MMAVDFILDDSIYIGITSMFFLTKVRQQYSVCLCEGFEISLAAINAIGLRPIKTIGLCIKITHVHKIFTCANAISKWQCRL